MTTALIGLVGVIVGSLLTTSVGYLLQKRADERRWKREDAVKLRDEQLKLYRDYNREIERTRDLQGFNEEKLRLMMSEMELIASDAVAGHAVRLFFNAMEWWRDSDIPPSKGGNDRSKDELDKEHYEFTRTIRQELGIWKDWSKEPPPKPLPKEKRATDPGLP